MISQPLTNPFVTLRTDIEAHWRQFCPRRVAVWEKMGTLQAAIEEAAVMTERAVLADVERGVDFWQAWESHRDTWAFVPPEAGTEAYGEAGADDTWMADWQPDGADFDDDDDDDDDAVEGGAE